MGSKKAPRPVVADDPATILTLLGGMPRRLAQIARGCDDARLHRQPASDAWSARDIVAHLRACAVVWSRSIERMLDEEHPTIRYVSPRGWIKRTDFLAQGFSESMTLFTDERTRLVRRLEALKPAAWQRGATFTGTTAGRDATVLTYASRIATHEQGHLDQVRRTLGKDLAGKGAS